MRHTKKAGIAVTAAAVFAMIFAITPQAEARRAWRAAPYYRAPAARYYAPRGRGYYAPRRYATGYRGYGGSPYGYRGYRGGGVNIGGPRFGVSVGW